MKELKRYREEKRFLDELFKTDRGDSNVLLREENFYLLLMKLFISTTYTKKTKFIR